MVLGRIGFQRGFKLGSKPLADSNGVSLSPSIGLPLNAPPVNNSDVVSINFPRGSHETVTPETVVARDESSPSTTAPQNRWAESIAYGLSLGHGGLLVSLDTPEQYGAPEVSAPAISNESTGYSGPSLLIAVIDTGIGYVYPEPRLTSISGY